MIRIEDAVDVEATVEEAFAFVTRIEDYPAWLPGLLRAEPSDPQPTAGSSPAVGARFRLVSAGPGGMEVVSAGRVEAVDAPRSISISASSSLFGLTATCEVAPAAPAAPAASAASAAPVEPNAPTRTRITVRAAVEPRGLATFAAGRIEQELRASVPDTLRRLREAVEGLAAT
jgi:carbon monoxide dehydrogenase subunit G